MIFFFLVIRPPINVGIRTCIIFGLIFLIGCGQSDQGYPIAGKVLVDGHPTSGVYVVFHGVDPVSAEPTTSSARTAQDGSFSWRLPSPGDYSVTAFWPRVIVSEEETTEGPDQFRGRYLDPQSPIRTVTITQGENVMSPLELSSR